MPTSNLEILKDQKVLVSKIGGDNACNLRDNYQNVKARLDEGQRSVLVVSAIRSSDPAYNEHCHPEVQDYDSADNLKTGFNTTSHLKKIGPALEAGEVALAFELFSRVQAFTMQMVKSEISEDPNFPVTDFEQALKERLRQFGEEITSFSAEDKILYLEEDTLIQKADGRLISLTGFGESLSKFIYQLYFEYQELKATAVDTDESFEAVFQGESPENFRPQEVETSKFAKFFKSRVGQVLAKVIPTAWQPKSKIEVISNEENRSEAELRLRAEISRQVSEAIDSDVLVLGGYAPLVASERGYSDKMGALVAAQTKEIGQKVAYLIEKQSPIMSADPRKLDPKILKVIEHMGWDLAKEVFGVNFGADGGAVQHETLDILQKAGVDIFVANPNELKDGKITRIYDYEAEPNGIEMVAVKSAACVLQVKSSSMNEAGISARIGSWLAKNGFSYDHGATSETTMTYTFGNQKITPAQLADLEAYLGEGFELRTEEDISLVYCMGNNMGQEGPMHRAVTALALEGISARLVTQGINQRVMVFGVDNDKVDQALAEIHAWGVQMSEEAYQAHCAKAREDKEASLAT